MESRRRDPAKRSKDWDFYLETQQELEHREYLKREEDMEKLAERIKELESRLTEVSNREEKSRKRLAEVRSTCSREIKLLRNMLR